MEIETEDEVFECPFCDYETDDLGSLKAHIVGSQDENHKGKTVRKAQDGLDIIDNSAKNGEPEESGSEPKPKPKPKPEESETEDMGDTQDVKQEDKTQFGKKLSEKMNESGDKQSETLLVEQTETQKQAKKGSEKANQDWLDSNISKSESQENEENESEESEESEEPNPFKQKLEEKTQDEDFEDISSKSGESENVGLTIDQDLLEDLIGLPFDQLQSIDEWDKWELSQQEKKTNAKLLKEYAEENDIDLTTGTLLALNLGASIGGRAVGRYAYHRDKKRSETSNPKPKTDKNDKEDNRAQRMEETETETETETQTFDFENSETW